MKTLPVKGSVAPRVRSAARGRRARIAGLMAVLAAFLVPLSGTATADTPQPDGPPDGGDHSWCYLDSFNQETAADAAMTRLRNQTDVTTNFPGSCLEHTDVRWRQDNLADAYGEAECRTRWAGSDDCDTYRLTLDMGEINAAPRPVDQRSKTSCHELGHTVGVRHYFGTDYPGGDTEHSCLRSGEVTAAWTNITLYGNHHRNGNGHINDTF